MYSPPKASSAPVTYALSLRSVPPLLALPSSSTTSILNRTLIVVVVTSPPAWLFLSLDSSMSLLGSTRTMSE